MLYSYGTRTGPKLYQRRVVIVYCTYVRLNILYESIYLVLLERKSISQTGRREHYVGIFQSLTS